MRRMDYKGKVRERKIRGKRERERERESRKACKNGDKLDER
jgi:hypothetical protein